MASGSPGCPSSTSTPRRGRRSTPQPRSATASARSSSGSTWLYVDAVRGTALRKEERLTRLNRWLYHGLHSFDFPFLYSRRPLWDVVVITLSAGGLVLSIATIVPALRRFRRHARRLASGR